MLDASYVESVIARGDVGSSLLKALTVPTCKNLDHLVIREGFTPATVIPEGQFAVASSHIGDNTDDPEEHAYTAVKKAVLAAQSSGAKPLALSNIVDTPDGDEATLRAVADGLKQAAYEHSVGIVNGENAILGRRVGSAANVTVTLLSSASKIHPGGILDTPYGKFVGFDPKGNVVVLNSDGTGTKVELYERAGTFNPAADDLLAMNLDDSARMGAIVRAFSGVVEYRGNVTVQGLPQHLHETCISMYITALLELHDLGSRINGRLGSNNAFNLNGTAISTVDEHRLANPLQSQEGEYLIAIRGVPNPRANGISAIRRIMENDFGPKWHEQPELRQMLDYVTTPSTVLYPVFTDLINKGFATNVYHLTGGSFESKLAKPLAAQELFVNFENQLPALPDEMRKLADLSGDSTKDMYRQWPMGIDGFVSVPKSRIQQAISVIAAHNLHAYNAVRLQAATADCSGVALKAFDGTFLHYSGRGEN